MIFPSSFLIFSDIKKAAFYPLVRDERTASRGTTLIQKNRSLFFCALRDNGPCRNNLGFTLHYSISNDGFENQQGQFPPSTDSLYLFGTLLVRYFLVI